MQVLNFTYTKDDGTTSTRKVAVVVEPTDKFAGIDITNMPDNELNSYAHHVNEIKQQFIQEMQELNTAYGLARNYRQFFGNKMTDIFTEVI